MKLPSAAQTREWDAFTMAHEPVASIDLMERAAAGCTDLLLRHYGGSSFCVICGTGNNGGDGLAIARMLFRAGALVRVFLAGDPATGSADFRTNYGRLLDMGVNIAVISEAQPWPDIKPREVCVDALLGTGINRPVRGWLARLIRHINASNALIVSIDVPSGFRPDLFELQEGAIIEATETITFQRPLPALLFEEHAAYAGNMTVLDIGLHPGYLGQIETELQYLTQEEADHWIPRRKRFGHKNSFGHVQIMAGSKGKMGAAILSASAAMHAGAGLITASIPACGYEIFQIAIPEAMCISDEGTDALSGAQIIDRATVLAMGPGLGTSPETALLVERILRDCRIPLVCDADALNLIARSELVSRIPKGSVLTPHPGEFDRLFGYHKNHLERYQMLRKKSAELGIHIVLKGAYTCVATAQGETWINFSGNAGMATAGSGDVLTGIIAAFMARGMEPSRAAIAGVYVHGHSGDLAASRKTNENLLASDLIELLPDAMRTIRGAASG